MQKPDYYHEIARKAKAIADRLEDDAEAAVSNDGTVTADDVNDNIEARATLVSAHSAFGDRLPPLWTEVPLEEDTAVLMAEIIEVSSNRFGEKVGGRPKTVLKRAAAATVKADIRDGVSEMLRQRLIE